MKNPLFTDSHPATKLLFTFFIILSSFLIIALFGLLLSVVFFDIDISNLNEHLSIENPENLGFMKFMQIIQSVALFVVPPLAAAFVFSVDIKKYLNFNNNFSSIAIVSVLMLTIFLIPVINFFAEINSSFDLPEYLSGLESYIKTAEDQADKTTKFFLNSDSYYALAVNILMVALIPAIGEELMFRGLLLRLFSEWTKNFHAAIIISAFIFSFIHFQFYGFLPRLLMGILFGYLVFWSRNLWYAVFAHFINNAIGVGVYFYYSDSVSDSAIEKAGTVQGNSLFLFISIFFVALAVYLFYKSVKEVTSVEQKI